MERETGIWQLWPNCKATIMHNYEFEEGYDTETARCKHFIDGKLPRVLVLTNEGGYNSCGICLECVKELLNEQY